MLTSSADQVSNGAPPRRTGLARWELAALLALAGVAGSVLLPLLSVGLPLSGAFGIYAEDQLQYFAWIREASAHVLAGDRFDLAPGMRTFLHPGFVLSGLLHAGSGLSIPMSYLLWEPIAIALLFVGFLRYVRRLIPSAGAQQASLALALFSISPLYLIARRTNWVAPGVLRAAEDLSREMWMAGYLWGYPVTAIAIALMPLVLLSLESWRTARRTAPLCLAVAGAALISWLHPWQGATLLIAIAAAEALALFRTRQSPRAGWLAVFAAFTAPAAYYVILSRIDPVWRIYQEQNAVERQWLPPLFALLPLAVTSLLAYRRRTNDWQALVVRAWPLAALVVYIVPIGTYPFHAFDGIVLPLAILAVEGIVEISPHLSRAAVFAAIALMSLPGWADSLRTLAAKARSGEHGYFITTDERQALSLLERDRRAGGVLSTVSTGALIPFTTGREVYVGHDSWSPQFHERSRRVEDLFRGRLSSVDAQAFVRSTHARFLVGDCRHPFDLSDALRPLLASVRRFGCATIYELFERSDMPTAAGPPDA